MQFSTCINNVKAVEWGLSVTEAYLFSFLYEVPSWCADHYRGGYSWKWISRDKIISELPLLNLSSRSVYRLMKGIEAKGLIVLSGDKSACKTLMRLTEKGREWHASDDTYVKSDNGQKPMTDMTMTYDKSDKAPMTDMTMAIDKSDNESVNHISVNHRSNNQDQKTHVPSDDDTTVNVDQKSSTGYTPEFEQAWSEYPKRSGANNKKQAFKRWQARIKEGVTAERMTSGVRAYSKYCKAAGIWQTKYVMLGATFFGPDERYNDDYSADGGRSGKVTADRGLDEKDYSTDGMGF